MATVITRSAHPDALWPGVMKWFGLNYDEFPDLWPEYYDRIEGELATERLIEATSFGLSRTKTEGAPITYDTDSEGYANLATPAVIGLGYQVTREELEDGLYTEVSLPRARSLAFSQHITTELIHANLFLNGFAGGPTYGDGATWFSTTHTTKSGNQSNLNGQSNTAADFSEASLEDMVKQIYLAKNSRGLQINLRPVKIMVSAADMFNTTRVLESQLRTSTANNDINAVKQMGLIPEGVLVNPYLGVETTQAWYVQTSVEKGTGAVSIWRREPELERDNDYDTQNAKALVTSRFVPYPADWRGWFANAGV